MTWSMFSINFLDVGLKAKADRYFIKSYSDYVHPKFKVWAETNLSRSDRAVNFLTGIGGFLQSLIYGYGGLRFTSINDNRATIVIQQTYLPPNTSAMTIHGNIFKQSLHTY